MRKLSLRKFMTGWSLHRAGCRIGLIFAIKCQKDLICSVSQQCFVAYIVYLNVLYKSGTILTLFELCYLILRMFWLHGGEHLIHIIPTKMIFFKFWSKLHQTNLICWPIFYPTLLSSDFFWLLLNFYFAKIIFRFKPFLSILHGGFY